MTHARSGVPHLVLLALAISLTACGAGGGPSSAAPVASSPPPPTAKVSGDAWQGRYVGTVKIGTTDYFGDALLTGDGAIRLYVGGGPYANSGALQRSAAAGTMQLIGTLAAAPQGRATGQGLVLGENCAASSTGYCAEAGTAALDVSVGSGDLEGQVSVTTSRDSASWSLTLSPWTNYYQLPATPAGLTGTYKEQLAEFAVGGDALVTVDAQGSVSFHGARTGCSGAGSTRPRPGGAVNVYDVTLTVAGCVAPYDYLNAQYQGLATTTPSSVWDYDSLLRMWLSRAGASVAGGSAPALTTLADPQ